MPTFIDESGDTGEGPDPDNRYFRLAAVWIPTADVVEAIRAEICQVRRDLGLPADYEFKFSKTARHAERRDAFFRAALRHEFRFAASSINKRSEEWRTAGREAILWAAVVSLAGMLRPAYCAELQARGADARRLNEPIIVDNNEDKQFLSLIKRKFRELGTRCDPRLMLVGKVRFHESEPDELIQLADMVCGTVGAHLDGNSQWYRLLVARDLGITRLP